MCGIVGYAGNQQAAPILLDGLSRLEYRGYDSAGIAILDSSNAITVHKAAGKIDSLMESLNGAYPEGSSGIGHTRWATHGSPTQVNAHPHTDCSNKVVVVHNGIVENYIVLKRRLEDAGHSFRSETDSEVIAHLIESLMSAGNSFEEATKETARQLRGAQAVAAMEVADPSHLVAFRLGNAGGITVGYGKGEMFLASDLPALLPHTSDIAFLASGEMATVKPDGVRYQSIEGKVIEKKPHRAPYDAVAVAKGGFRHFMLKEITEQPEVIRRTLSRRVSFDPAEVSLEGLELSKAEINDINRVVITGMGTSLHAGQVARFYMEALTGLPAETDNASELRYRRPIMDRHTLVVSVSQSGETADTLAAMEEAARYDTRQITICNVESSQASRLAHGMVNISVGPEICVASTKCLTGSMVALYLLSTYLGRARGVIDDQRMEGLVQELTSVPRLMGQALEGSADIESLAQEFFHFQNFLYLGRGINTPIAMEGALKLKEVSYIHAEGYAAGEMKHGPIALIDENMPVVVIALQDHLYDKMRGNVEEVKARGGTVIALVTEGDTEMAGVADRVIHVPKTPYLLSPLVTVVPLQMLAYHIAVRRGCDVDQPRNLAKTVTVE